MNEIIYQIGMPVERLSTAFMLWVSYERPCKILVLSAKTDDWAIIELKHEALAAAITETIHDCQVAKMNITNKIIQL